MKLYIILIILAAVILLPIIFIFLIFNSIQSTDTSSDSSKSGRSKTPVIDDQTRPTEPQPVKTRPTEPQPVETPSSTFGESYMNTIDQHILTTITESLATSYPNNPYGDSGKYLVYKNQYEKYFKPNQELKNCILTKIFQKFGISSMDDRKYINSVELVRSIPAFFEDCRHTLNYSTNLSKMIQEIIDQRIDCTNDSTYQNCVDEKFKKIAESLGFLATQE
jgi:hypothetical protein